MVCLLSVFLWTCSQVEAAPTKEELFKMMAEKQTKVKTMEADMINTSPTPMGSMKATGHIVTAKSEVDGKTLHKYAMNTKSTMEMGGQSMTSEVKIVSDGVVVWQEMRMSMTPEIQVVKQKAKESGPTGMGPALTGEALDEIQKTLNLGDVTEETLDGRKVYRVEGTIRDDAPNAEQMKAIMSKITLYVDQENLVVSLVVMSDAEGKEVGRMEIKNLKLNHEVDPKVFDYTPPAGARVRDMTKEPGKAGVE